MRKYSHLFKSFPKYFVRRKGPKEVTKLRLIKEKLFPEQNPDVLENNCSKIQTPSQANRSDSQSSRLQHFEYYSFSMPNSKVKFLRGTPTHTPVMLSKKKSETIFNSPFSVSSEEYEHFEKTDGNEGQLQMEPLESKCLFQIDEELEDESKVDEKCPVFPPSVQPIGIPDHLKYLVADCSLVFSWLFPTDFASSKGFMDFLHECKQ